MGLDEVPFSTHLRHYPRRTSHLAITSNGFQSVACHRGLSGYRSVRIFPNSPKEQDSADPSRGSAKPPRLAIVNTCLPSSSKSKTPRNIQNRQCFHNKRSRIPLQIHQENRGKAEYSGWRMENTCHFYVRQSPSHYPAQTRETRG